MKIGVGIVERMLLQNLFGEIISPMSIEKITLKNDIVEILQITDEEKKAIDFVEKPGAVKQAQFDVVKAAELKKEIEFGGWVLELIKTWLYYSALLDDMKTSHFSLYMKFCRIS